MTTPQDPVRLVGRSVKLEIDDRAVPSTVIAVGSGGIVVEAAGEHYRIKPADLHRLDVPA